MSEVHEYYADLKEIRRREGQERRLKAIQEFPLAKTMAEGVGLTLSMMKNEGHYQLTNGAWVLNLYPGNQRVYADHNKPCAPWLDMPHPWTLRDVVIEAAKESEGEHE